MGCYPTVGNQKKGLQCSNEFWEVLNAITILAIEQQIFHECRISAHRIVTSQKVPLSADLSM